jgi:UDPglucose 6-dehydrogenase
VLVIGTGHVGLVVGARLADAGHDVVCADVDARRIDDLRHATPPIDEPGLAPLVGHALAHRRLQFTTEIAAAVPRAGVILVAVDAPPDAPPDSRGAADLSPLLDTAALIGEHLVAEVIVVLVSVVPPGTGRVVEDAIAERTRLPFHLRSSPTVLPAGIAVESFLHRDRIVLGVESEPARATLTTLLAPFSRAGRAIVYTTVTSAEATGFLRLTTGRAPARPE